MSDTEQTISDSDQSVEESRPTVDDYAVSLNNCTDPVVLEKLLASPGAIGTLAGILEGSYSSVAAVGVVEKAIYLASQFAKRDGDAAVQLERGLFHLLSDERECQFHLDFGAGTAKNKRLSLGDYARDVYELLIEHAPSFHVLNFLSDERLVPMILSPETTFRCRDRALSLLMSVVERDALAVDDLEALIVDTDKTAFGPRIKWWFAQKYPMVLRHCYAKHNISFLPMPPIEVLISTQDADETDDVLYGEFAAAAETTNPEEILRVLENPSLFPTSEVFVAIFLALSALKHPRISSDRVVRALEIAKADTRPHHRKTPLSRTIGEQADAAVHWWWQRSSQHLKTDDYLSPSYVCTLHGGKPQQAPVETASEKKRQPAKNATAREPVAFEYRWLRHFLIGDVCPDCGLQDAGGACSSDYHQGR